MNRAEYEVFRDENLKQRFYLVYRKDVLSHLLDCGYRYLYKAINTFNNKPFWIFDRSDELLAEVEGYKTSLKKPESKDNSKVEGEA